MALINKLLLQHPTAAGDSDQEEDDDEPVKLVKARPKPVTKNTKGRNALKPNRSIDAKVKPSQSQQTQVRSAHNLVESSIAPQRSRSRSPRHQTQGRVKLKPVASHGITWSWTRELSPNIPVEVHTWRYNNSDATVTYAAVLISPLDVSESEPKDFEDLLPVAFYYSGLGMTIDDVLEKVLNWRTVVKEPFVLVVPQRPKGKWWFITDETHWGWLAGDFDAAGVELFSAWMHDIVAHPRLDCDRVGLLGFSAGAYAATELLALGAMQFSGIAIGGVHGHGQRDLEDVPKRCKEDVLRRFHTYLKRLQRHQGVNFFEATHAYSDMQCRWKDATQILDAIRFRQEELRFPDVSIRLLNPEEQDSQAGGRKNKTHHDYFNATFLRSELFVALFGGPAPCSKEVPLDTRRPLRNGKLKGRLEEMSEAESSSSEPDTAVGPPRPPVKLPPTSLSVSRYMVRASDLGWEDAAFEIFAENGFVLVEGLLKLHQYNAVLKDCEKVAQSIVGKKRYGNRGAGRYSFGVASSTSSMLHVPSYVRHLLNAAGSTLRPLLDLIFEGGDPPGFSVLAGGGDFVLADVETYQNIHSDVQVPKHLRKKLPPPLLSVNYCVQALDEQNGPTRIIPGTQLAPPPHTEPGEWRRSRLCPVPVGAAFVRDTRTLHGGTPNLTNKTRYLPSIEYVSAEFRATNRQDKFPPYRSLPFALYEKLPSDIQELCEEIVMEQDDEVDVSFKRR